MRKLTLLLTVLALSAVLVAQKQPSSRESTTVVIKAPAGAPGDFVGSESCGECHVDKDSVFRKTAHAIKPTPSNPVTGCEGCHGPGKAHVDGMRSSEGDDAKIAAAKKLIFSFDAAPRENSARCLGCHVSSQDQQHFDRSEHYSNGLACQTCHSAHLTEASDNVIEPKNLVPQRDFFNTPRRKEEQRWLTSNLLRKSQPELCFSCHNTVQAQFTLPSHHRVPEGLMKCTDCHSPHGTRNQPMLKKTNWEGCINCHAEKRGPFVYEHAAVKVEGCTACHSPHGTVSRMLLLRREGRFLCLQCHVDPQAPNVPHGRLGFTTRGECNRCHVAIHGSNSSPFFLNN
jgi:predicted CXXCH cytochrome family protein